MIADSSHSPTSHSLSELSPTPRRLFQEWRPIWLIALVLGGLAVSSRLPTEIGTLLEWGEWTAGYPIAVAALVALMALLFTFALPGSLVLWLIAPFQAPVTATALLLVGSVGGALGAYFMAQRLRSVRPQQRLTGRVVALMQARGDGLTQTALRVLPGLPHSVVNYAAGFLHLPLPGFIGAAMIGLTIKWAVYSTAIHEAVETVEHGGRVGWDTMLPLLVLSIFLLLGAWVKRRLASASPNGAANP